MSQNLSPPSTAVGFPGGSVGENQPASAGDMGREDRWRRKWQATPVFLPGKSHGQRSLGGLQSAGLQKGCTRLSD